MDQMSSSKYEDHGNCTLTLQDVQQSYESSYIFKYKFRNHTRHVKQCNGGLGIKLHVFNFAVTIVVEKIVRTEGILRRIDNWTVTKGQSIRLTCFLTCAVKKHSNLAYIWYKNKQKFKESESPLLDLDPVSYEDMASYTCVLFDYNNHQSPAFKLTVQRRPRDHVSDDDPDGGPSTTSVPALSHSSDSYGSIGPNTSSQKHIVKSLSVFFIILGAISCVGMFIAVIKSVVVFILKKSRADSVARPSIPSSDIYMALDISSMSSEYDTLHNMRHCMAADPIYENLYQPGEALG